jgi:hypothetical protein
MCSMVKPAPLRSRLWIAAILCLVLASLAAHLAFDSLAESLRDFSFSGNPGRWAEQGDAPRHAEFPAHEDDLILPVLLSLVVLGWLASGLWMARLTQAHYSLAPQLPPPITV